MKTIGEKIEYLCIHYRCSTLELRKRWANNERPMKNSMFCQWVDVEYDRVKDKRDKIEEILK